MSLTFVSVNLQLQADYETILKSRPQTCADKPCLNGGICHDVEPEGLYCQCCYSPSVSLCGTLKRTRSLPLMYAIHFSKVYCVKRENIVVRYKYEKKCRHESPAFFKFLQTALKLC